MQSGQTSPAKRSRRRHGSVVRSYELALTPNRGKAESARHAIWWATRLCRDYVQRLYWLPDNAFVSTAGRGNIDNQAQARARNLLRAGRLAARASGTPFCPPASVAALTEAEVRPSRGGTMFDLWVKIPCGPWIPAKTHRAFGRALRAGAVLRPRCEVRIGKNGSYLARVFVEYPKAVAKASNDVIGADVGLNVAVATSDGRCSRGARAILERSRERAAERRRQGHRRHSARSAIKQQLDREARRLVTLAIRGSKTIAIERLRALGNLKPAGIAGGWARRHFGLRVRQIAEEVGSVAVVEVNPAFTSQACPQCDHVDRLNRSGTKFRCRLCGFSGHADTVGARNVARKARGEFPSVWGTREGRETNTNGDPADLRQVA